MQNQLQKLINIAKKTGDRLIVFDPQNQDNVYVVMSLEEYENLAIKKSPVKDLTEDELLDKINRDIAIWKNEQEDKENKEKIVENIGESSLLEDNIDLPNIKEEKNKKKGNSWVIPTERKEKAEEIIEEDRQYLEEVSF